MLDTEPQLIENYIRPGKIRLVYRHLLQLGESSELLAEMSECAADQNSFWEMRQALYARYDQLYSDARAIALEAAAGIGLDAAALGSCLDAHTHGAFVRADYAAAVAEGIRSRPVFVVGDTTLIGAQRFSVFQQLLDAALAAS